jgi:hypothetical protein
MNTTVEDINNTCLSCGGKFGARRRVGPTGRKNFNILIESCYRCGILRNIEPLTKEEQSWLDRYNNNLRCLMGRNNCVL